MTMPIGASAFHTPGFSQPRRAATRLPKPVPRIVIRRQRDIVLTQLVLAFYQLGKQERMLELDQLFRSRPTRFLDAAIAQAEGIWFYRFGSAADEIENFRMHVNTALLGCVDLPISPLDDTEKKAKMVAISACILHADAVDNGVRAHGNALDRAALRRTRFQYFLANYVAELEAQHQAAQNAHRTAVGKTIASFFPAQASMPFTSVNVDHDKGILKFCCQDEVGNTPNDAAPPINIALPAEIMPIWREVRRTRENLASLHDAVNTTLRHNAREDLLGPISGLTSASTSLQPGQLATVTNLCAALNPEIVSEALQFIWGAQPVFTLRFARQTADLLARDPSPDLRLQEIEEALLQRLNFSAHDLSRYRRAAAQVVIDAIDRVDLILLQIAQIMAQTDTGAWVDQIRSAIHTGQENKLIATMTEIVNLLPPGAGVPLTQALEKLLEKYEFTDRVRQIGLLRGAMPILAWHVHCERLLEVEHAVLLQPMRDTISAICNGRLASNRLIHDSQARSHAPQLKVRQ